VDLKEEKSRKNKGIPSVIYLCKTCFYEKAVLLSFLYKPVLLTETCLPVIPAQSLRAQALKQPSCRSREGGNPGEISSHCELNIKQKQFQKNDLLNPRRHFIKRSHCIFFRKMAY